MSDPRADLVRQALTDPKFREELLRNPNASVEKAAGVKIPGNVVVKVLEDSATVIHLVLPQLVSRTGAPLSEADLAAVSGGAFRPGTPQTKGYECGNSSALGPVCII